VQHAAKPRRRQGVALATEALPRRRSDTVYETEICEQQAPQWTVRGCRICDEVLHYWRRQQSSCEPLGPEAPRLRREADQRAMPRNPEGQDWIQIFADEKLVEGPSYPSRV